jgi:hypothetical protein
MKKNILVPPMFVDLVESALTSMDGVTFTRLDACPSCGGPVVGHDIRAKRFAVITEGGGKRTIQVHVKRFYCQDCGSLCYADSPFYPDTRLGSPIVDLCVLLLRRMPYNRAARYLRAMGVVVDRGTIRNYASRDFGTIPATDLFGLPLPFSLLNLSVSAVGQKRGAIVGAEALAACGFPSADRAGLSRGRSAEERDQRDKQKEKEERKV